VATSSEKKESCTKRKNMKPEGRARMQTDYEGKGMSGEISVMS